MTRTAGLLLALALLATACSSTETVDAPVPAQTTPNASATSAPPAATTPADPNAANPDPTATGDAPAQLQTRTMEIVSVRPHDPGAWTQGLILHEGRMFESTGASPPPSTLREVDPATGEVLRLLPLDDPYYAEGLERVDDRLVQLTWRDQLAFVYDLETFERVAVFEYEGEGWGLCREGARLVMSNGTDVLQFRDPLTFAEASPPVRVTLDGQPLDNLNELECVDGTVWANVWLTDLIVGIDPGTGAVVAVVDGSALPRPPEADVLNGIAHDPASGNFLITGKNWPDMYEVRFVPTP